MRIVNLTSSGAKVAIPLLGASSASKFGLEGMSDPLRRELIRHRILKSHWSVIRRDPLVRSRKDLHKWRVARPWDLLFFRKLTGLSLCNRDLCGCCDLNPWAPRVNGAT